VSSSPDDPRLDLAAVGSAPFFGPKGDDHPSVGVECPACHVPFKAGDFTTLVALGPGDSQGERARAREGRPYTAVALEVHVACATGIEASE
jgi:hypothetical protein